MDEKSFTINVAEICNAPLGQTANYKLSSMIVDDEEIKFVKPVDLDITLTKIDTGILAAVVVNTEIELICSRCAKNFNKKISLVIEQVYSDEPNEESDYFINKNMTIDFGPIVRDEIILSLPIKILCMENCPGPSLKSGE